MPSVSATLERRLSAGPLERTEALRLWYRLLLVVHELQARGGCHGLLAPENILLDDAGRPSLLYPERGRELAGKLAAAPDAAVPPARLAYLAPEARQDGIGPAADVYGLGLLLFELLIGERPQPGDALAQMLPELPAPLTAAFEASYTRLDRRHPSTRALIDAIVGTPAWTPESLAEALGVAADPGEDDLPAVGGEALTHLDTLLAEMNQELREATDALQAFLPLIGLLVTLGLWPFFSWVSLAAIPLALMARMMRGDVIQKRRFMETMLERIGAFCDAQGITRVAVWQHVSEDPDRYGQVWIWMQYVEPYFLPEELQSPPRRMGGVSKVPWS